jgi:hypothetical protein
VGLSALSLVRVLQEWNYTESGDRFTSPIRPGTTNSFDSAMVRNWENGIAVEQKRPAQVG